MNAVEGQLSRVGGIRLTGSALVIYSIILLVLTCAISYYLLGNTPQTTLRFVGGLFFLLFLPGFVLCWAMFPDNNEINFVERLGLSFGLSVPLTLAVVLVADHFFKVAVTPLNIVLSIGVVLLVFSLFGVVVRFLGWRRQGKS